MKKADLKKYNLPDSPGVYFFMKGKIPLYIGKATSLQDRVRSYFPATSLGTGRLLDSRGPMILDMSLQAERLEWQKTDSVLEALILEAELIKKYQPKYNVKEKDDRSWNYVCITNDAWPRVLVKREKELNLPKSQQNFSVRGSHPEGEGRRTKNFVGSAVSFGPYTNGAQLKEAMKVIRRIFPFLDENSIKKNNREFYRQLGLTPEDLDSYKKNIKNLKLFFQGKKKKIIQNLKKEMMEYAKKREFEKAGEIKKRIFALGHINDVALIKSEAEQGGMPSNRGPEKKYHLGMPFRIEAYDIAHMSGKNMVGVMTVLENKQLVKTEYKKFIIKTQNKANDTGALEEVLSRRLCHPEWGIADLIVVDGGLAQMNTTKRILLKYQIKIPVVGVVKDEKHKAKAILGEESIIKQNKKAILLANAEAHRFAISFYRQRSRKSLLK